MSKIGLAAWCLGVETMTLLMADEIAVAVTLGWRFGMVVGHWARFGNATIGGRGRKTLRSGKNQMHQARSSRHPRSSTAIRIRSRLFHQITGPAGRRPSARPFTAEKPRWPNW
jgi:hypothetical protein